MSGNSTTTETLTAAIQIESDGSAPIDPAALLRGVRIVLSGIKRMHGRFGKAMIAQMLGGSQNKKIQQWKLNRLSTYGMLSGLKQPELSDLIDAVIAAGMAQQIEVDERRPTVQLTEFGEEVMHAREPLPASLKLSYPLARRLARIAATIEGGDVSGETADRGAALQDDRDPAAAEAFEASPTTDIGVAAPRPTSGDEELTSRLKRWRGKTSAALGIPAYRVLSNATIERLVAEKPETTEQLEMIHGVGPSTIEQFGYDLIRLINEPSDTAPPVDAVASPAGPRNTSIGSATSNRAEPPQSPQIPPTADLASAPKAHESLTSGVSAAPATATALATATGPADPVDAYWTWRMLRDGYPWNDVALIRRKSSDAILQDLITAAAAGHEVRPSWAATAEQRQRLERLTKS